jgi:hypothetical protein
MQGIAYKIGKALDALGEFAMMATSFINIANIAGCATTKESTSSSSVSDDKYVPPEMSVCKEFIERVQIGNDKYDAGQLEDMLPNCEHLVEKSPAFDRCLSSAVFDTTAVGDELDMEFEDCRDLEEDKYIPESYAKSVCFLFIKFLQNGHRDYEVYELENLLSNCEKYAESSGFSKCLSDEIVNEIKVGEELEDGFTDCTLKHGVSNIPNSKPDTPSPDPDLKKPPTPAQKTSSSPSASGDKADLPGGSETCLKAAGGTLSGSNDYETKRIQEIYDSCLEMVGVCKKTSPPITLNTDVGPVTFDSVEKCIEKSAKLAAMGYKLK